MFQLPYCSALHPSFIQLPLLPWGHTMWGWLAATDPCVTAVHLCHQAYVGPGCGFSEQLQVQIPAGLQEPPLGPLLLSPSHLLWVPHLCHSPGVSLLWGDAPHQGVSGSNAHMEAGSCARGQAAPYLSFPTDRTEKPAVLVRLVLSMFSGTDCP